MCVEHAAVDTAQRCFDRKDTPAIERGEDRLRICQGALLRPERLDAVPQALPAAAAERGNRGACSGTSLQAWVSLGNRIPRLFTQGSYSIAERRITFDNSVKFKLFAVLRHPVSKQGSAGLEVGVIESMVRAGIDNELDWPPPWA